MLTMLIFESQLVLFFYALIWQH